MNTHRHIAAGVATLWIVALALSELANVSVLASPGDAAPASYPPTSARPVRHSASPSSSASPTSSANPSTPPSPTSSASPSTSPSPTSSASPSTSPSPTSSASPASSPSPTSSASPSTSPSPTSSASPSTARARPSRPHYRHRSRRSANRWSQVGMSPGDGHGLLWVRARLQVRLDRDGIGPSAITVTATIASHSSGMEVGKFSLNVVGGGSWSLGAFPQVVAREASWPWSAPWTFDSTVSWAGLTNVSLDGSITVVLNIDVAG